MELLKEIDCNMYEDMPECLVDELRVLTKGDRNVMQRLKEIHSKQKGRKSFDVSVQLLKEELRGQNRGNVSYISLEKAYKNKNYKVLINLLEELFLDEVTKYDIDVMYQYIINENKLKELHMLAEKNERFIATVMSV